MLGAIVGDIVGSPYELGGRAIKTKDFPLFSSASRFTDDTVMTIAVAVGVMQGYNNPGATKEALIDAMQIYGGMYPDAGYGQQFASWISQRLRTPYGSYGNGSAMRVSPVAWAYHSLDKVVEYARISAEVTHNHPEGVKGACATAAAIFMARTGASKEVIKAYLSGNFGYNLEQTLDNIRPAYMHDSSCQGSVPESIIAFLESTSFEDALRNAVSLGGDTDTMAAIAGSIAEAFYGGLPSGLVEEVMHRLPAPLRQTLGDWQDWLGQQQE